MIICPVCSSSENGAPSVRHRWNGDEHALYACAQCRLFFWHPRKMPSPDFYERDAEKVSKPVLVRHTVGSRYLGANHQAFFLRHPTCQGRLLDIGCGDGHFLQEAQRRGCQVTGVDLDSKALLVARRRGIERLLSMTLEAFVASDEPKEFDWITFFEVLEHQPEPVQFITNVKRLMRVGGRIAGSVPNCERFRLSAYENLDRPPYHFTRWTREGLIGFLTRVGFRDILVYDVGFGYCVPSLLDGLNYRVKSALMRDVDEDTRKIYPIEQAVSEVKISGARLAGLKMLKRSKAILLAPVIVVEQLAERLLDKGQMLYFEATWQSSV